MRCPLPPVARFTALGLLILAHATLGFAADQIVMDDGRILTGTVEEAEGGKVLRIVAPDKVTTVAASRVRERKPASSDGDLGAYEILSKPWTSLDPKRKYKGQISPDQDWGQPLFGDHGMELTYNFKDKKLGNVVMKLALVRLMPQVGHYHGIDYEGYRYVPINDYSDADLWYLLEKQVLTFGGSTKTRGWTEVAHFLRKANRPHLARKALDLALAEAKGNTPDYLAAEKKRQDSSADAANLERAQRAADRNLPEAGLAAAKAIQNRDVLSAADKAWLETFIADTEKAVALRDAWRKLAAEVAQKLNGGAAPNYRGGEPVLTWPVMDTAKPDECWGPRAAWLSVMLTCSQAQWLETHWPGAKSAATPVDQARMLWLGAWYAGSLKGAEVADSARVALAAEWIAKWAAAPRDEKKGPRGEVLKFSDLGSDLLRRLVAAAALLPCPADQVPSPSRELSAPTPNPKLQMKYLVALPPDYNPSLRYPLVIMFHGASSTPANALTWFDRGAAERGFVLAAPEFTAGKSGTADEHYAVSAVAEDLSRRVRLDPDRVFLCGASMGGHAAWDAATAQFDRLAGLLTIIGCPQGLAWTYGGSHAQHLAVYAIDGDLDINAPAILRRATVALQKFGCDTTYVEYFGQGHVAYPQEYPNALDWMRRKSRDAAPKKLTSYVVRKEEAWRAWANVEEFSGPKYPQNVAGAQLASLSGLIGTWSDNTLKLETFNVGKLEIFFDRRLVDFNQKIVIVANDKECANELVKPSIEFALKTCEERGDRGVWWEASTTVRPPKKR